MRVMAAATLLALVSLAPGAGAQTSASSPPAKSSASAGGISRQDYIKNDVARAQRFAGRRFDVIDAAHKGTIARQQYVDYYKKRAERFAGARFDRVDTDHNGILEPSEIAAWRAAHTRHPPAPAAK